MSKNKLAWLAMVPALWIASSASARGDVDACVFEQYAPLSVAPLHQDEHVGLGTHSRLGGVQVYVAAQPGLTAEWLALRVQRELDPRSGSNACQPSVRDVRVSVTSGGSGFWVMLSAPDERSAGSLLAWARRIVPGAR